MSARNRFRIYVITPNKEQVYITCFTHLINNKPKIDELRARLYFGHTVLVKGTGNSVPMACYRPMTRESMIDCVEALAPYRRRAADRLVNLAKTRTPSEYLGIGDGRSLGVSDVALKFAPSKPVQAPLARSRSLTTRIAENISQFEKGLRERLRPALIVERIPLEPTSDLMNTTSIPVIEGVQHIPGLPRVVFPRSEHLARMGFPTMH